MKKCKYLFLFIISLFIIIPKNVNAETMQYNFCFSNGGAYSVSYDSNIATEVTKEKIDYEAVKNGHVAYPNNATTIADSEKAKYAINVAHTASKCTINNDGTIQICPINKSALDFNNIVEYYLNTSTGAGVKNTINMTLSGDKINIKIKKYRYGNKTYELHFRPIYNSKDFNKNENDASYYTNEFLTSSGDYYILNGINFNQKLIFEIYENDSSDCNGTYLGDISFLTPDEDDFIIENPAPNYEICKGSANTIGFVDYYPNGIDSQDEQFNQAIRDFIPECYISETPTIRYSQKNTLENDIKERYDNLRKLFEGYDNKKNDSSTGECEQSITLSKTSTKTYANDYWFMVCDEEYTAQGDTAKLVRAGQGFEYVSNFKITRTCRLTQKKKAKRPVECEYTPDHTCTWDTRSGTDSGKDAGPSDYFDACISNCDGGKYTQSCINSCYKSSYTNTRNWDSLAATLNTINNSTRSNIEFVERVYTSDGKSSPLSGDWGICTTDHGRPGKWLTHTWTYGGKTYSNTACFSQYCANNNGKCVFYLNKNSTNCSDNPDQGYQDELNKAQQAYTDIIKNYKNDISTGSYTIEITDSFLTSNKQKYVFTVTSKTEPNVFVIDNGQTNKDVSNQNVELGTYPINNRTINIVSTATSTKTITVKLPLSYVNKVTGGAVYKSDETTKNNAYEIFQNENGTRKLRKVQQEGTSPTSDSNPISNNGFVASRYYHQDDERKYYTSIWSQNTNVFMSENRVQLMDYKTVEGINNLNIKVISKEVGDGGFESNILCYYGVYNSYYCDNKDDCPVPECKENCPDPTGIQYIYRVIDLTDVFPNDRNPRWNWTSSAARKASETRIGYDIDPITKTKDIESKGESIYTDQNETDYEFYLTKENIRNIRDYNKHVKDYNNDGSNNYLDYNMNCYIDTKGRQICTSKFLDNINGNSGSEEPSNYVTYGSQFTRDMRVEIAKCNDATGGGSRCVN